MRVQSSGESAPGGQGGPAPKWGSVLQDLEPNAWRTTRFHPRQGRRNSWVQRTRKNSRNHIAASHSRQPLVKGERLVRYEVNAVIRKYCATRAAPGPLRDGHPVWQHQGSENSKPWNGSTRGQEPRGHLDFKMVRFWTGLESQNENCFSVRVTQSCVCGTEANISFLRQRHTPMHKTCAIWMVV